MRVNPAPRRVLMLVNQLTGGGTERNVAMLCRYADRTRYLPEVWTLVPDMEGFVDEADLGARVRCLHRRKATDLWFAVRTARQIARAETDMIHAFLPAIAFYAALARRLFGIRVPMIFSEATDTPATGWAGARHRWTLRHFHAFTANSTGSRQHLSHEGVDPQKIRIIPNGHDVSAYRVSPGPSDPARRALRAQLGLRPDDIAAITVGRLIPTKRVNDAIDAMALLANDHPKLRLLIAGSGHDQSVLAEQAGRLGIADRIRFLGRREDVRELLQAADLFVFPSEVEGLPNSVIEAALAGLPIIAGDIPGTRDIVRDGNGGWLVPCRQPTQLAAAIREALAFPEVTAQRAKATQEDARQRFDIHDVVRQWCDYYDHVLFQASQAKAPDS